MTSSTDDRRAARSAPARDLEGDARLGQRALGADDALGDGRLGDEEGARDLLGRQAAEQAQRERDARLGREHRMAGGEDQAQQVVADVVVERGVEIRRGLLLLGLELAAELARACARASLLRRSRSIARCLAVAMSQAPGLSRDARLRPPLERERPARPAPGPRPGRRRAPCGRGRRSASPTRCARPRRWRDGYRVPSQLPIRPSPIPGGKLNACRLAGASAPIPKFASYRGEFDCELRN